MTEPRLARIAFALLCVAMLLPATLARANGIIGTEPHPINPEEPCAEAVGRIGDETSFGTGVMIGDRRIVVTVAHAVLDAYGAIKAEATFSLEDNLGRFHPFGATVVKVGTRNSRLERADDWALLVMDHPPEDRAPLPVELAKTPVELFQPGYSYSMIGFSTFRTRLPGSGYKFPVISRNCGPTGENIVGGRGIMLENCSTMPGGSGSPLIEPAGCKVVALDEGPLTSRAAEALPDKVLNNGMAVYAFRFREDYARVMRHVRRGLSAAEIAKLMAVDR